MADSAHTQLAFHRLHFQLARKTLAGVFFRGCSRICARVLGWKKRAGATFWRLADKRIPKEWIVFALGGLVLFVYVLVLFFGTRPRK